MNEAHEARYRRNLRVLREHSPKAATAIEQALIGDDKTPFALVAGRDGTTTLSYDDGEGSTTVLSANADPVADKELALQQLLPHFELGTPIAFCGCGDGYLLAAAAEQMAPSALGAESPVFVLVPDARALSACFFLHDYSEADGAIERFRWYVGESWLRELQDDLAEDLFLPPPTLQITLPPHGDTVCAALDRATEISERRNQRFRKHLEKYYAGFETEALVEQLGESPRRAPRIAFVTTRFSTVLQFATRDLATSFRELGWEVEVILEPTTRHRMTAPAVREVLARFRPDLFFQIDHLRAEHGDLVPTQLPFISWAQDLLPNLLSKDAATTLGERDFLLTFDTPLFCGQYGYPRQRCVAMPVMLTLSRERPTSWDSDGPELVYASNMSETPQEAYDGRRENTPAHLHALADASWEELQSIYSKGQHLCGHGALRSLVATVQEQCQLFTAPEAIESLINHVLFPLNSLLFRQQGLEWVADIVDREERGWQLALYGKGWARHPRFARYARGVLEHGEALAEATRRAQINLNLEPYPCFSHQRLLDGLAAGGFFLVRDNPANTCFQELSELLVELGLTEVEGLSEARQAVRSDEDHERLQALVTACAALCYAPSADPIEQLRSYEHAAVIVPDRPLPDLAAVSFTTAAECRERIDYFLSAPDERRRIADAQWQNIRDRLTFPVAMKRVIGEIRRHLEGIHQQ